MSHKHHSQTNSSRDRKRSQFGKQSQQKISPTAIVVIALTAVLAVVLFVMMGGIGNGPTSTRVVATNATNSSATRGQNADASETGDVLIPISDVSSGKAKFYDYTASDSTGVRFFVIKSSNGVYRAALDACDICYAARKGYYQDGDNMVCKKCSRQFPSALVNEVSGGCNPVPLTRTVDGDKLIIKGSELENYRRYF